MMKDKKSQITIFIIIGIVLLFSSALILYIRGLIIEEEVFPEEKIIGKVPVELNVIDVFIKECVRQTSIESLRLVGVKGGYTDLDKEGIIIKGNKPTESDGLYVSGNFQVPYWFYLDDNVFSSKRPNLYSSAGAPSIEGQINDYVNSNLKVCLGGFMDFEKQGFEFTEIGAVDTKTTITDRDIRVVVNYPLKIRKDDRSFDVEQFYIKLPLNMKRIYELATDITNAEMNYSFLEMHTLNLVSAFGSLDANLLPPISATDFTFDSIFWIKNDVEEKVKTILMDYADILQTSNTLNFNPNIFTNDKLRQSLYNNMILPLDKKHDLSVEFTYLSWWPIHFDLNCDGQVCKPDSLMSEWISFMGLQRYEFNYDISYPVLVEVRDTSIEAKNLFGEDGYLFYFALEENLRDNNPVNTSMSSLKVRPPASSLFCNINQRNSGNITIKAVNRGTSDPEEGVRITYMCANEGCTIGSTGSGGVLKTRLPVCSGGALVLSKQDFFSAAEPFDVLLEQESDVEIVMDPFRTINFTVMTERSKITSTSINEDTELIEHGWGFDPTPVELDVNENGLLNIQRNKGHPDEEDVVSVSTFNKTSQNQIRIVPGNYTVDISFFRKDVFVAEAVMVVEDEEITLDAIEFETFPAGGVKLDDSTYYWVVEEDDLYKAKSLIFYVVAAPGDTVGLAHSDLGEIGKIKDYTEAYRAELEPEFVK